MKTNRIALVIAVVALGLSLYPYIRTWTHYPSVSHVLLHDSDTGERIGFVRAEYGGIKIACFSDKNPGRTELSMSPEGVAIRLYELQEAIATWTLSEHGATFERHAATP